ncbi:Bifunctional P450:NADPH-P450 reductase [Penicillium hispanicum]|uniref:Bifunctional P450:NADPH-P450 reductase n=1 Tax=Penicillium hispanicum TaxID=1080232 RepID=UPI002541B736|nr:Bifunctional P450:NADPH-P450 reductase [Penicillium hispanicum]KAJ5594589.1 Bifunctional P450:NADPH-P450 reductase [Penicillium hispanicum]
MPSEIPPPGIPLMGNIFDVSPNNTWGSLDNLAKKSMCWGGHQIVFIGSVALLEELCDQTRFRKCVMGPVVAAVHDSLFTAYDHEKSWGIAHRIIMPPLTQEATDSPTIFNDMVEVVGDLTKKWSFAPKQCIKATEDLGLLLLAPATPRKRFSDEGLEIGGSLRRGDDGGDEANARLLSIGFISTDFPGKRAPCVPPIPRREKLEDSQIIDEVVTIFIGAATAANPVSYALYYLELDGKDYQLHSNGAFSIKPQGVHVL